MVFSARALTVFQLAALVLGTAYHLEDSISGSGFNSAFSYQAISDPTNGRVNYVDASTAKSKNLTFASGNTFVLRADHTTTLSSSGPGRNSVRLQSNKQYTTAAMIFDIRHMPEGCGTWPAVWTVGANWPSNGEVDILEGVNNQGSNQATLHTSSGCTMPSSRTEQGTVLQTNCDGNANNNAGCGVKFSDSRSFGPTFNSHGGGWYVMERTNSGIKVWFWARDAGTVPSDVKAGGSSVDTSGWGTPQAFFPSTSCNIAQHFGPHNIIINLTFCGDWAGQSSVYASSGCPSTCVSFVNSNPSAFNNAFFDFASIKVYT